MSSPVASRCHGWLAGKIGEHEDCQALLSQRPASLTFFIRVINVRLVLQQDLADGGLALEGRDE